MMPQRGLELVALHPLRMRRLLLLLLGLASAFVRPVNLATRRVPPPTWLLLLLLLLLLLQMLHVLLQRPLLLPLIPGMRLCRGAVWPVCHRAFRYTMCAHHTIPSAWLCQKMHLLRHSGVMLTVLLRTVNQLREKMRKVEIIQRCSQFMRESFHQRCHRNASQITFETTEMGGIFAPLTHPCR
jgi:hypothetical protein